jgi:hypothetical protein
MNITEVGDVVNLNSNITSSSLQVTPNLNDPHGITIELYVDVNDRSFYVNGNYTGPDEKGTLAKPYKHIESALYAFIGRGTRWNPEWKGRGKIILLSYIATSFNMTAWWNHTDLNGNLVNQIKDNNNQIINSQINTNGWISVNHVNIDGQGNTLEYQSNTSYWISTEKFINSYDSTTSTLINNAWSAQNLYNLTEQAAATNYTIKRPPTDPKPNQLNIDIFITIKNVTIVSSTHEIVYHLNYGFGLFVPQPGSNIKFTNCTIYDYGIYSDYKLDFNGGSLSDAYVNAGYTSPSDNFNGQYIKATNKWNSIQTHFGSEIWIENRIKPDGTGTGFTIPTDKYMIRIEGRNWNNEGYFEMTDCNLIGSSSTIIFIKNTSTGFTNLKMSRSGSFISYGENAPYNGAGKDYYNHQIDISFNDPSTAYAYSPYSNSSGTVKKAKAWVNRFMPKKNLFYIRIEGDTVPVNGGIATNAWCRVVNLNIENSFPVSTWRNNQRGVPFKNSQNSPYNPQNWIDDAAQINSININYNQKDYFKSQIGGSDALFKMVGNSYFRIESGFVYGEQTNNLIHKSQYASVDFIDCNFDLLECIDIPGPQWSASDNLAKRGAFKLNPTTPLSGLSEIKSIGLYSSKVNFVIFKGAAPYPTNIQFYEALRDGIGWDPNFIFPYSPDSTINKVNFSSTTPMIGSPDVINAVTNSSALNTNVGYNPYKLIPGNKYYNTSGGVTVVKVPITPGATITLPVEFGSVITGPDNHTWPTQP